MGPRERKEVALQMSSLNVKDRLIHHHTGISERSMWKTFRETGEVVRTPVCAGRPRTLDTLDANVSYLLSLLLSTRDFLRRVSSDNRTFFLLKCKISCGRFVASRFRLQRFQEHHVSEDLQGRRSSHIRFHFIYVYSTQQ